MFRVENEDKEGKAGVKIGGENAILSKRDSASRNREVEYKNSIEIK